MDPKINIVPIDQIAPCPQNPKLHPEIQISQIARSIQQFEFINPLVTDDKGEIIAGHGRYLAALKLGLENVPVIQISHLSKDEERAYRLADNKIAENAEWDKNLLAVELSYLLKIDAEFDVSITGFSVAEIDVQLSDASPDQFDDPPPPLPEQDAVVSRKDDIWLLGPHRAGVGDCLDPVFVDSVMHSELARMSCIDPPYNVKVDGHVCGKGKVHHDEFAMASGEMTEEEFIRFLLATFTILSNTCTQGALHYIFMDWRHLYEALQAGREAFDTFINCCVWTKTNGGMGSLYRSQHEICLIFKTGFAPHINNVELGRHGRNRANVWSYPGMNSFGAERKDLLSAHPTVKPVSMIADAIRDVTHHGDIVFDGFLGSGTTLLAADKTHRVCYAIEIDPRYMDVALRRWMNETGKMPVLESSGKSFEEVSAERLTGEPKEESHA